MNSKLVSLIAQELSIAEHQVQKTIDLLSEGATIPFISRYRKEMTGNLDEVQVGAIKARFDNLTELEKRKETILKAIEEQDKLTDDLANSIKNTYDANELEDLYLPYKQKRKTKADIARQKGLESLAKIIMAQKRIQRRRKSLLLPEQRSNINRRSTSRCSGHHCRMGQ